MAVESRCARCGRVVDLARRDTAKVARSMVPADLELPHDTDLGTLAALFCSRCWPPR